MMIVGRTLYEEDYRRCFVSFWFVSFSSDGGIWGRYARLVLLVRRLPCARYRHLAIFGVTQIAV